MRNSMRRPATEREILDYARRRSALSAVNTLILMGPDNFAGNYEEYLALERKLSRMAVREDIGGGQTDR